MRIFADIGATIGGLAPGLFRAHVRCGPEDHAGNGPAGGHRSCRALVAIVPGLAGVENLGEAEVEHLRLTRRR